MICFDQDNNRFNFRVVGIAVHDNRVLLHQAEREDFWTFPGGRVEMGEAATQTLQREMQEELAIEIEVVRLLWVVENFFAYDGKNYHELSLYFLMRLPETSPYLAQPGPYEGKEPGSDLIFQWFPNQAEVLAGLPLLPSFLPAELQRLPASTQHRVHYGE